jgi:hypothetical protein
VSQSTWHAQVIYFAVFVLEVHSLGILVKMHLRETHSLEMRLSQMRLSQLQLSL